MTASRLTLVSHTLCPYVQRATIALLEKGVAFERRYVDLSNKPDWFLAISPLGKAPLLVVARDGEADAVLFESAVICEYLEETQAGAPLHPSDPLTRAQHRGWIEFSSTLLMDLWGLQTAPDEGTFDARRHLLVDKFARVEASLGQGPFFTGEAFSLVDVAFAPVLRYFDVLDAIRPTRVLDTFPGIGAWRKALTARPSVRDAVQPDYAAQLTATMRQHGGWLFQTTA
jgi:glutathione S-transferase